MSCVNDHYTPEELESIFLWDCLCEALPLTAEERREINSRDSSPERRTAKRAPKDDDRPKTAEDIKKEELREKKREQNRRWRKANKDRIRAYDAAYRAVNRESINERQREYDRAKAASKKATGVSAQS